MLNTGDKVEGSSAGAPARWSIAGLFLEGLAVRDFDCIASTLDPNVRMRALLPSGPSELQGREAATQAFQSWFGSAEQFELVDAVVGEVGGRLHVAWRARVHPAPFEIGEGWHVIEQHAFADAATEIESLDLLCSGFRAESARP